MNDASPDTVTDAVALLRADGYTADYDLIDGELRASEGCPTCSVEAVTVEHLYRFEGDSDPGDEMVVFGLYDEASGTRGTLAAGFGPSADPDLAQHLRGLAGRF